MTNQIEVEMVGVLSKEQYIALEHDLQKNGTFLKKARRVFLRFCTESDTGPSFHDENDFRFKVTNGTPELVYKKGKVSQIGREEIEVSLQKGQSIAALKLLSLLGYSKAIMGFRIKTSYEYKSVRFDLTEVPKFGYYFEAEKIISENDTVDEAKKEILAVLEERNLEVLSESAYEKYIDDLDTHANLLIDTTTYDFDKLEKEWLR